MKNMVLSLGALTMAWGIGYGVQAAAWIQTKVEGEKKGPATDTKPGRLVRLQRVA